MLLVQVQQFRTGTRYGVITPMWQTVLETNSNVCQVTGEKQVVEPFCPLPTWIGLMIKTDKIRKSIVVLPETLKLSREENVKIKKTRAKFCLTNATFSLREFSVFNFTRLMCATFSRSFFYATFLNLRRLKQGKFLSGEWTGTSKQTWKS